jgi:propionyl-CoA synthetase
MTTNYREQYRRSIDDPSGFWGDAAQLIDWITPPGTVLDESSAPFYRWFPDGEMNTAYNALDRHVAAGRGEQTALIYDSPVTGTVERISYADLTDRVARTAGALRRLGIRQGDRVLLYLPMIPEAVITMLACARLGAIHSVVFGGFAPRELAARIDDARPKVIVAASCGIEGSKVIEYKPLVDAALALIDFAPLHCLIVQRPQALADLGQLDLDFAAFVADSGTADCVPVRSSDPLYILYTSGTTGRPKGVVRDNAGHAVALAWSMANVYGVTADDVFWAASDVGWVVGHSYIVYAPLLVGCTTVLYEGKPVGTPDAGAFWRVISEHRVNVMFTAPTAIRAIRKEDPHAELRDRYDLSSLRALFLAGERLDPDTFHWAGKVLDIPVIDHWWQTETGWSIVADPLGLEALPVKAGSPTVPMCGWDLAVLDDAGQPVAPGEEGAIVLKLPLPPGSLLTLWNADARYVESYLSRYRGYYLTGDYGHVDEDGYVFVMGRIDDVINVAGHRLSTGAMEQVIAAHPAVAECAVVGVADALKGQLPRAFVVLKAGVDTSPAQVRDELVALVRAEIGPVAALRQADVVAALPKTRSGKILRSTLRAMADGREVTVPSTIDDASVLTQFAELLGRT